jgi:hypothetical protein
MKKPCLIDELREAAHWKTSLNQGRFTTETVPRWLQQAEAMQAENKTLRGDVERLNQMLRQTGYGQGQIDAHAAISEEYDGLLEKVWAIRDRYPADVFPPDSKTPDAAGARFARGICDEILNAAARKEAEHESD